MIFTARKKNNHGFTLIELLIVIAILGILAAAVLVAINPVKRQNQARDAQTKGDIGAIATALLAYYTSHDGGFPTMSQGLTYLDDPNVQELKQLPTPPQGTLGAYDYRVDPLTCDNLPAGTRCAEVRVYNTLLDPLVSGNVWCFRSFTGKASEVSLVNCPIP